jgi:hypothetical protein
MSGHLLHVGFPKTGSNFLRGWFRDHPQLAYSEGGIAGYHGVYEIAREGVAPRPEVRYRVTSSEEFTAPHRDTGREHYRLDDPLDPAVAQENACTLLASLFPNAHVLIVTRGFRSMIFSSFSQYVRTGAGVPFEEFVTHPLIERPWDYDRVIGIYRNAFGADKVLVMPYELLRDDVERFVRTLEERLGLAHCAAPPGRPNTALSPAEMYWYPRLTRLVQRLPIGSRLKRTFLRGIFRNRLRPAIALLQRVRPGTLVTEDAIPEQLIAAYRARARSLRENPLYAPYAREYYGLD